MVLIVLLLTASGLGVLLGLLARMSPRQIVAQCAAMCAAVVVFYSLVSLL